MERPKFFNLPNCLTMARIIITPFFLAMLFAEAWYWKTLALAVFGLASLTDFYDGRLARSGNRVTAFGRFMDPLADKVLVTAALIAFVIGRLVNFWLVVPVIARDVVITALRLYSLYRGQQMATSRLAKWKTAVQLFAVVFILFTISLKALAGQFGWEGSLAMDEIWVRWVTDGLMGLVLFLTLLSGLKYLSRSGLPGSRS
jgi:CDP-diacylglycerol--glycerol-3-phosphate 3-phosphatidyltransferase